MKTCQIIIASTISPNLATEFSLKHTYKFKNHPFLILISGNLSLIKHLTFFFNKCTVTTIYSNLFPLYQMNFTTGLPVAVMLISL